MFLVLIRIGSLMKMVSMMTDQPSQEAFSSHRPSQKVPVSLCFPVAALLRCGHQIESLVLQEIGLLVTIGEDTVLNVWQARMKQIADRVKQIGDPTSAVLPPVRRFKGMGVREESQLEPCQGKKLPKIPSGRDRS